jgi:hypothetical protein
VKQPTEFEIERSILDWLNLLGAFACKINLGGKPIKTPSGNFVMAPFSNPYYRKGMSDIVVFYRGKTFAFEVKTPSEYQFMVRHWPKVTSQIKASKRIMHLREQWAFIQSVQKQGSIGAFVCSIAQVKDIIEKTFQNKSGIVNSSYAQPSRPQ